MSGGMRDRNQGEPGAIKPEAIKTLEDKIIEEFNTFGKDTNRNELIENMLDYATRYLDLSYRIGFYYFMSNPSVYDALSSNTSLHNEALLNADIGLKPVFHYSVFAYFLKCETRENVFAVAQKLLENSSTADPFMKQLAESLEKDKNSTETQPFTEIIGNLNELRKQVPLQNLQEIESGSVKSLIAGIANQYDKSHQKTMSDALSNLYKISAIPNPSYFPIVALAYACPATVSAFKGKNQKELEKILAGMYLYELFDLLTKHATEKYLNIEQFLNELKEVKDKYPEDTWVKSFYEWLTAGAETYNAGKKLNSASAEQKKYSKKGLINTTCAS